MKLKNFLVVTTVLFSLSVNGQTTFPIYSFSGFPDSAFFRNIYLGRFEYVWFDPNDKSIKKDPFKQLLWGLNIKFLFFADHLVFSKEFAPNYKDEKLLAYNLSYDNVVYQNGFEIAREKNYIQKNYLLRPKYYKTFDEVINSTALGTSNTNTKSGDLGKYISEMSAFLNAEGINAPTVKLFEENLLRATREEKPLQSTFSGIKQIPLFADGWKRTELGKSYPQDETCLCIYSTLKDELGQPIVWELEDNFTQERFLYLAISKATLLPKLWDCLHKK